MVMMMFVAVVIVMRLVVHIRTFPGFVIENSHWARPGFRPPLPGLPDSRQR
jgi:nitrogen fixation protein FixH